MSLDAKDASVEIVGWIRELYGPPEQATLGGILGGAIFKAVLRSAGYAIVPLEPSVRMEAAYRRGWFKSFDTRYKALVEAALPEAPPLPAPGNPGTVEDFHSLVRKDPQ